MNLTKDEVRAVLDARGIYHTRDCRAHNPRGAKRHQHGCPEKLRPETLTMFGGYHCICDWRERLEAAAREMGLGSYDANGGGGMSKVYCGGEPHGCPEQANYPTGGADPEASFGPAGVPPGWWRVHRRGVIVPACSRACAERIGGSPGSSAFLPIAVPSCKTCYWYTPGQGATRGVCAFTVPGNPVLEADVCPNWGGDDHIIYRESVFSEGRAVAPALTASDVAEAYARERRAAIPGPLPAETAAWLRGMTVRCPACGAPVDLKGEARIPEHNVVTETRRFPGGQVERVETGRRCPAVGHPVPVATAGAPPQGHRPSAAELEADARAVSRSANGAPAQDDRMRRSTLPDGRVVTDETRAAMTNPCREVEVSPHDIGPGERRPQAPAPVPLPVVPVAEATTDLHETTPDPDEAPRCPPDGFCAGAGGRAPCPIHGTIEDSDAPLVAGEAVWHKTSGEGPWTTIEPSVLVAQPVVANGAPPEVGATQASRVAVEDAWMVDTGRRGYRVVPTALLTRRRPVWGVGARVAAAAVALAGAATIAALLWRTLAGA